MVLGWWGIISFFTNCFFIYSNIVEYVSFLMSAEPIIQVTNQERKRVRPIHPHSLERIERFRDQIQQSIQNGEPMESIRERFSDGAMVPPSEIDLFIASHLKTT
jgi:hypothetical protein